MVNTETFGASLPHISLGASLSAVVGELVTALGRSLADEAGLESLYRLSSLPRASSFPELLSVLRELEGVLGSPLLSDYAMVEGLRCLANVVGDLSQECSSHLAGRARRYLNTVTAQPPLASEAARLVEQLEQGALFHAGLGDGLLNLWSKILEVAQSKMGEITGRDRVRLAELGTFLEPGLALGVRRFAHFTLAAAENLGFCVARGAEAALGARPLVASETLAGMVVFERCREETRHLASVVERLGEGEHWRRARRELVAGQVIESLLWVDTGLADVRRALEALRTVEPQNSGAVAPQRFLDAENYLYVRGLARHLIVSGEAPRDVEKLAASLFEYASKGNVPCLEVLDEEILALNPNVRRECLLRARLELRLNCMDFPLSVAHKDWIQRTVKGL